MQQVGYGYAANGLLASITYPSGGVLAHLYDAAGRLTQLNWNGSPLVTGLAWNALGQPTGWSWAFVAPSLSANFKNTTRCALIRATATKSEPDK